MRRLPDTELEVMKALWELEGRPAARAELEAAGCTPDMSNEELCDALIATFPTITLTGLTGDGAGITWDASGEVSKSPKGMVIENGAYVGMD